MPYGNVDFLKRLVMLLGWYIAHYDQTPQKRLFVTAACSLGTDASPNDVAPDEYGCAETVDTIHRKALGTFITGTLTLSTAVLYKHFLKGGAWVESAGEPGDIVISPTGWGTNPAMPNGHVGYVSIDRKIMSNSSATGMFEENYNLDTWRERYVVKGGYPMKFYKKISI